MAVTPQQSNQNARNNHPATSTPDPNARAGTKNSLGAESVRDGRPSTDDDIVEAMDEEGPGITAPLDKDLSRGGKR